MLADFVAVRPCLAMAVVVKRETLHAVAEMRL
jgi:hypothetical protein